MAKLISVKGSDYNQHNDLIVSNEFYRNMYNLRDLLDRSTEVCDLRYRSRDLSEDLTSYFRRCSESRAIPEQDENTTYLMITRDSLGEFLISYYDTMPEELWGYEEEESRRMMSILRTLSKFYSEWDDSTHLLILDM